MRRAVLLVAVVALLTVACGVRTVHRSITAAKVGTATGWKGGPVHVRKGDKAFVDFVDKSIADYYKSGQTQKWYEEFLVGFYEGVTAAARTVGGEHLDELGKDSAIEDPALRNAIRLGRARVIDLAMAGKLGL